MYSDVYILFSQNKSLRANPAMKFQRLATHRNYEDFISAFVMRGERRVLSNVMVNGLVASREEGRVERKESSMGATDKQQNKLVQAVERVHVHRGHIPKGIVPSKLAQMLRSEPTRVEQDDISRLHDVHGSMQCVRDGRLTHTESIALYLRSYRNILEYELSDLQQLKRRFLRYVASIFVELEDLLCYPDRDNSKMASSLLLV